jgi:integrase
MSREPQKARRRGEGSLFLRGRIWWICYSVRGRQLQESSKSEKEKDAVRLLRQRLGEVATGTHIGPKAEAVTFENLMKLLAEHYEVRRLRSAMRMRGAVAHLAEHFAGQRALEITSAALAGYQLVRSRSAAPATASYELAMLKKAFSLATKMSVLPRAPNFPNLTVSNARQGFFEEAEVEALCRVLPHYLAPVVRFAVLTGWRRQEILGLTWERVDFETGVIRLDVRSTKNEEGRTFPMDALPALLNLMKNQRSYTDIEAEVEGHSIPWIFHRRGKPLRDNYRAWRVACEKVGLAGKLLHDLRRTAVRNLERAGVSRSVAMKLTGHKTEAVYRRYAIVNEADLREGVAKLARSTTTELQQSV